MDNGMQLCQDIDIGIRVTGEEYKLKCNLILENITVVKKFPGTCICEKLFSMVYIFDIVK